MPMHDWTRVKSGTYHNFHLRWLASIMDRMNSGVLPPEFFAMAQQRSGGSEADILTLSRVETSLPDPGGIATLAPPKASIVERAEKVYYARKSNRIAIHHGLGKVVAFVELISPGNKATRRACRSFARKSAALLWGSVHLSVIDPFPPGRFDPNGIHRAIWDEVTQDSAFVQPADKRLTLVAYEAGVVPTAYVEPFAVGQPLPDLPVFLQEGCHVLVPLEETYQTAWEVMPLQVKELFGNIKGK